MNTIWKLWVTLTLLYLLLASHRGEVVSGVRAGYRVSTAVLGVLSQELTPVRAQDIVITPCNLSGECKNLR